MGQGQAELKAYEGDCWHVVGKSIVVFVDAPELAVDCAYRVEFDVEVTYRRRRHGVVTEVAVLDDCGLSVADGDAREVAADIDAHRHREVETAARRVADRVARRWADQDVVAA